MNCPMRIWVSSASAEIDKEYIGYKTHTEPNSIHYCSIVYKGYNTGWVWNDAKQVVNNIAYLERYMTFQEERDWYIQHYDINDPTNKINLEGLFHDMYDIGDAHHELWNAWIGINWREMALRLLDEDFYLIGIAPCPWGHGGYKQPIAFVVETKDGTERFWCHGEKDWVLDMREEMKEVYNERKCGRPIHPNGISELAQVK